MSKSTNPSSISLDTPDAFFFELVHEAVKNQKIRVQAETEYYLVRLLNRFIFSESLYSRNQEGQLQEQPLAFLMKEALEAEVAKAQKSLFQNVGDISLYKAGFFQESLSRSMVDLDYYIGIGGSAYLNAAQRCDEKPKQHLFSELAQQFPKLVSVLGEVSEKTTFTSGPEAVMRMFDIYSRTKSERAAKALQKAGIPVKKESDNSEN